MRCILFGNKNLRSIKETCTSIDWFPVMYTRLVNWEFLSRSKRSCNENKIVSKKYHLDHGACLTNYLLPRLSVLSSPSFVAASTQAFRSGWNLVSEVKIRRLQSTVPGAEKRSNMRPGAEWEREGWNHIIIFGSPPEIWTRRRRRKGRMRRRPERRQIYRSAGVAAAAASFSSKTGFWDLSEIFLLSFSLSRRVISDHSTLVRDWVTHMKHVSRTDVEGKDARRGSRKKSATRLAFQPDTNNRGWHLTKAKELETKLKKGLHPWASAPIRISACQLSPTTPTHTHKRQKTYKDYA